MKKRFRIIRKHKNTLFIIAMTSLIGSVVLINARASTRSLSFEAESGQIAGSVVIKSGNGSSKDAYIKFGGENTIPTVGTRGPTGQWPSGFPEYTTPANIITDGSMASLKSALNQLGLSGGVIEHPGNISRENLSRPSGPAIVIRPPIGKRADYSSSGMPISSNLLLAGWKANSLIMKRDVNNSGSWITVRNSGFAWIEASPNAYIGVNGVYSDIEGHFYEIVYNEFADPGMGDRGGSVAASNTANPGGRAIVNIVGSIITGTVDAPYPEKDYHADTMQVILSGSGSIARYNVKDSVIYPSWDKAVQGWGNSNFFTFDNIWIVSPAKFYKFWQGPDLKPNEAGKPFGTQPYYSNAVATITRSTLVGSCHPSFPSDISNSVLQEPGNCNYNDKGGNRVSNDENEVRPPPTPTHQQLDQIWAP